MKTVSIIFPVYNEANNIKYSYEQVLKVLPQLQYNWELIYVDDGSTDASATNIKSLCAKDDKVRLVKFSRNFGKEAAMSAGLKSCRGDLAIIMDVDMQVNAKYLEEILAKYAEGYKLVKTFRRNRTRNPLVNFLSSAYYQVFNKISGINQKRGQLDFQVMDREVIDVINAMPEKNRYFKGITQWIGYQECYLEVIYDARIHEETKFGLIKLFKYSWTSIMSFSPMPLRIVSILGIIVTIFGMGYVAKAVYSFVNGRPPDGYTSIIASIWILFGVLFIILGVIGEYIANIYEEIKQRPIYIIDEDSDADN